MTQYYRLIPLTLKAYSLTITGETSPLLVDLILNQHDLGNPPAPSLSRKEARNLPDTSCQVQPPTNSTKVNTFALSRAHVYLLILESFPDRV